MQEGSASVLWLQARRVLSGRSSIMLSLFRPGRPALQRGTPGAACSRRIMAPLPMRTPTGRRATRCCRALENWVSFLLACFAGWLPVADLRRLAMLNTLLAPSHRRAHHRLAPLQVAAQSSKGHGKRGTLPRSRASRSRSQKREWFSQRPGQLGRAGSGEWGEGTWHPPCLGIALPSPSPLSESLSKWTSTLRQERRPVSSCR